MRVFIKKLGFIILIFLGLTTIISFASLWSLRRSSFYKPSFLVNQVNEKKFDYIILGASIGLTSLNSKAIDTIANTNGINLSIDDTALPSAYLMLQHFLAQGKTTKICVLAPSAPSFNAKSSDLSDNDYRFLPYVNSAYVSEYYKQFSSTRSKILGASKWMPVLGVSYYNTELFYTSILSILDSNKRNRFDDRGNYTYPEVKRTNRSITKKENLSIDFNNDYLEKIRVLCDQYEIELICYFAPMEKKSIVSKTVDYTIINHSDLLKNTMYFYDAIHVNTEGRQATSERFAHVLKSFLE